MTADATPAADPLAAARQAAVDAVHEADTKYRQMTGFDAPNSRVVDAVLDALEAAGLRVVAVATIEKLMDDLDAQTAESEALDERLRGVTADRYEQIGVVQGFGYWPLNFDVADQSLDGAVPVYRRVSP